MEIISHVFVMLALFIGACYVYALYVTIIEDKKSSALIWALTKRVLIITFVLVLVVYGGIWALGYSYGTYYWVYALIIIIPSILMSALGVITQAVINYADYQKRHKNGEATNVSFYNVSGSLMSIIAPLLGVLSVVGALFLDLAIINVIKPAFAPDLLYPELTAIISFLISLALFMSPLTNIRGYRHDVAINDAVEK